MTTDRLRYVHRFRDRHGKERVYLRRKGHKPIALPASTDPSFLDAYNAAKAVTSGASVRTPPPDGTLDALADSWFGTSAFSQLGPSTRTTYRRIIVRICRAHGSKPVAPLEAKHIRRILDGMAETPAAANHVLRTFRALLDHAVDQDMRPDNPARVVKRLKERRQGKPSWTEPEIAQFEAHWPSGTRPRLALAILLYTGQRRSDAVRMGSAAIDGELIAVAQIKTRTRLWIPLHPALRRELDQVPARGTFLETRAGAPSTSNGFYGAFKGWCAAAGLPELAPHGLRKAAARRLAEAGCSAHEIMAITGHKTLAEAQRYTLAVDQRRLAQAAMRRLSDSASAMSLIQVEYAPTAEISASD